ncbi:MAG: Biopolymer transport protein ExbB [Planctomycetota bacterium]|jgi:biopolymer transport protein ExbB
MVSIVTNLIVSSLLATPLPLPVAMVAPQDAAPAPAFTDAEADAKARLDAGLAELSKLRERIAAEKLPMTRELSKLEGELIDARAELQRVSSLLANRTLDLTGVTGEIKAREAEIDYLAQVLRDYRQNLQSGLHIADLQRLGAMLEESRLADENDSLAAKEVLAIHASMLMKSLDRIDDAFGGARFDGSAVDAAGMVRQGTFVLTGPAALFRASDGSVVGTADQRLGSLEPSVTAFASPELVQAANDFVAMGKGSIPFDPTLGNAHKIARTEETLVEHIAKGGPVMWPILGLAGAALLVSLVKWGFMLTVRMPSEAKVRSVLRSVGSGDGAAAVRLAEELPGPMGVMLGTGARLLDQPREVVEEAMYETVQRTQLKLQAWLPFVAITASAAPLLGLLGTVTGIMNTFKLINIYGTGDVKTLSSGISEALITTEFGLIVAIPSLLLHAYLSSKVRKTVNRMETAGIAFVNEMARRSVRGAAPIEAKPPEVKPADAKAATPAPAVSGT